MRFSLQLNEKSKAFLRPVLASPRGRCDWLQSRATAHDRGGYSSKIEFGGYSLIVDDIVYPDGRTLMGALGGGGPQTLYGWQLYTGQRGSVALAAGVGEDLPQQCREWLEMIGCDTSTLVVAEGEEGGQQQRTPRAWQLLEKDGRRTQVWRTPPGEQLFGMLRPPFGSLAPQYRAAPCFSIGVHPAHPPLELLAQLRRAAEENGGMLAVEPFTCSDRRILTEELQGLLGCCNVFSPNHDEAESMLGAPTDALDAARRLIDLGAGTVAVRCGPDGAVLASAGEADAYLVPAVQGVSAVDPTGCGNTFVGALVAALHAGEDLAVAGAWGCAAASVMLEAQGVPQVPPRDLHSLVEGRMRQVAARTQGTAL